MLFKKKCPSCGTKNPREATTCSTCSVPFELRQVEIPEAIKDCDEAIRLNPQSAEAYYKRGSVYQSLGQLERTIEDFDKAIRINPQFAKVYTSRAYVYLNKGQYGQAIADCIKAIKLDPKDDVAYFNRGITYKLQGNKVEAVTDFEKVITLSDDPRLLKMAKQEIKQLSK